MVYCDHCLRNVKGTQIEEGLLCCGDCGKVLEECSFCGFCGGCGKVLEECSFYEDLHYVDDYIHNEEGMSYKKIKLWEDDNHKYIKELAAKEEVAKKAFEAFVQNCFKNLLAARDKLAQSAVESIAKSRKGVPTNDKKVLLELLSENDNNLESKSKDKMKESESGSFDESKNTQHRGNGGMRKRRFVPRIYK